MTAVAAALLVTLVVRSEVQIATPQSAPGVVSQPTPVEEESAAQVFGSADGNSLWRQPVSGVNDTAYLSLRDRVLRDGVESWTPPASAVATTTKAAEPVLSYREQLNLLLKQERLPGS